MTTSAFPGFNPDILDLIESWIVGMGAWLRSQDGAALARHADANGEIAASICGR
jgi:hypothetical protein